MTDLRKKLIRLAHEHPELRDDLLPLLKKASEPLDRQQQALVTRHLVRGGIGEWDVDKEIERVLFKALREPKTVLLLKTECVQEEDGPYDIEVLAEIRTAFKLQTRGAMVEMTVTFPFYWEDMDEVEGR